MTSPLYHLRDLPKLRQELAKGKVFVPKVTDEQMRALAKSIEGQRVIPEGKPQPEGTVFVVYGAPRTKKTSNRLIPATESRRAKILPSKAWERWVATALVMPRIVMLPDQPYSCRALFYRHAEVGDACGFYQGLADALAHWKILSNDKLIVDWDGSRMLKDADRPRVEVILTPVSR